MNIRCSSSEALSRLRLRVMRSPVASPAGSTASSRMGTICSPTDWKSCAIFMIVAGSGSPGMPARPLPMLLETSRLRRPGSTESSTVSSEDESSSSPSSSLLLPSLPCFGILELRSYCCSLELHLPWVWLASLAAAAASGSAGAATDDPHGMPLRLWIRANPLVEGAFICLDWALF